MQIVIDISEVEYKKIIEYGECDYLRIIHAIENGAPLPEGHGKIGDLDAISLDDINFFSISDYCKMVRKLKDAPTIIEADKTKGSDKK